MSRRWTAEEDDFLRDHAGVWPMKTIAAHLGRTVSSVRSHRYELAAFPAKENAGMTALDVARWFQCPMSRVYALIEAKVLKAVRCANYWRIRPEDAEKVRHLLTAPKRTWKADPPDTGPKRPWEIAS